MKITANVWLKDHENREPLLESHLSRPHFGNFPSHPEIGVDFSEPRLNWRRVQRALRLVLGLAGLANLLTTKYRFFYIAHPGVGTFVANKASTAIRPDGHRTVEALFHPVFGAESS
jgi:hypothetical protein